MNTKYKVIITRTVNPMTTRALQAGQVLEVTPMAVGHNYIQFRLPTSNAVKILYDNEAKWYPLPDLQLSNEHHKLAIVADGKAFQVKAIFKSDAEANTFIATHPNTAVIDEDQHGNIYVADINPLDIR